MADNNNLKTCSVCGEKFQENLGSLSRIDNKTIICSDCGMAEAIRAISSEKDILSNTGKKQVPLTQRWAEDDCPCGPVLDSKKTS